MATFRTSSPSLATIFRFTATAATTSSSTSASATRRCTHCLKAQRCPFSSYKPRFQSSKRPLMTESASRPATLNPEAPIVPPRNSGSPETSISSHTTWPPATPWQRTGSGPGNISIREEEAQKSRPTTLGTLSSSSPSPLSSTTKEAAPTPPPTTKQKKSKLRPRKAPITLTPLAVTQLHALFTAPDSKLIRIGVKNRGCSGLAYHLEYVDKPGSFDEMVEQDGVKVLIDSKALFSIIGSEMDWVEDKLSARFIFRNPNITEQCGCGESFSIS